MPVLKFKDPEANEWKELSVVSDGVTFIPSIDDHGILSWSNNGGLDNPAPVNLAERSVLTENEKTDFPSTGEEDMIYIESKTNTIYRWDTTSLSYVILADGGGSGGGLSIKKVSSLPTTDISTSTMYLLRNENSVDSRDLYYEFIYFDGKWELIGTLTEPNAISNSAIDELFN